MARHLGLPHLQQEPSLQLTQPRGAHGGRRLSRLWAASGCGLRLAPSVKLPRGSCLPKIMALKLQLLLTQGSIVQSKSTDFPTSLGPPEWWRKRLSQAGETKARFQRSANFCETREVTPSLGLRVLELRGGPEISFWWVCSLAVLTRVGSGFANTFLQNTKFLPSSVLLERL